MRARRAWAGVVAAGVIAGLGFVGAAPASAAPSAGCDLLNGASGSGEGQVAWETVAFQAREQLTVTWSALSSPSAVVQLLVPGNVLVDSRVGTGSVTYVFAADMVVGGNSVLSAGTGTYSISCGVPALESERASEPTSSPAAIPAWVQAYGRASADAQCLEGWNPSWDLWPNAGKGGFVCQREIPSLG